MERVDAFIDELEYSTPKCGGFTTDVRIVNDQVISVIVRKQLGRRLLTREVLTLEIDRTKMSPEELAWEVIKDMNASWELETRNSNA